MKKLMILIAFVFIINIAFMHASPPHPLKKSGIIKSNDGVSELFGPRSLQKRIAPQNVLVLICEFSDVKLQTEPQYPDYHPHDITYFDKYMTHLRDYFIDASRNQYQLNYTIHPTIVELAATMGYYGDDSVPGERRAELARDVINAVDNEIDFNQYDAFILFHAGGGQESDIYDTQAHTIWSTFLTKANFRAKFDPNNMSYQGIPTNDGCFISEITIVPESERHPDFPVAENPYLDDYIFDIFGVLAHQFGHQLGLPTLFDNDSSNGQSAGIGNFGLMGTAVWNNNGKTPCLPSAWSRVYLGWNEAIVINTDQENLELTYPMDKAEGAKVVYKIPISENEYFLLENRQANFRKDAIEVNGVINDHLFSFDVLPDSLQDFYPETNVPMLNMMTNVLRGCEWDYFLPYVDADTGAYVEPSGILIWHIDENIINATFTDDFEMNSPNGNAKHKGVDLEEADGIQHLDSNRPHFYMRGSPYDAYREGNSIYFGKSVNPFTGDFTMPSSESYYGSSNIEVYNISASQDTMYFSVRFSDQTHFDNAEAIEGEFVYVNDFDNDGQVELYYIDKDDNILVDENGAQASYSYDFEALQRFYGIYAFDSVDNNLYFPCAGEGVLKFDGNSLQLQNTANNAFDVFIAPLITVPDTLFYENKQILLIGLTKNENDMAKLITFYRDHSDTELAITGYQPLSNMSYHGGIASFLARKDGKNYLLQISLKEQTINAVLVDYAQVINEAYLLQADFDGDEINDFSLSYKTENGSFALLIFSANGTLFSGFPVEKQAHSISVPVIADIDNNGTLDIIIGTETGYQAFAYNGALLNGNYTSVEADSTQEVESLITLNKGDKTYILASLGHGKLCLWNENGRVVSGYPKVYNKAKGTPFIYTVGDSVFAYIGTADGNIYRHHLSQFTAADIAESNFIYAYGNLNRTASWHKSLPQNILNAEELFIKGENYIYPNPWIYLYDNKVTIRTLLSKTAEVKVRVYNVAGDLVWKKSDTCSAFVPNDASFVLETKKLATGVYFAILEANNKVCRLKFAVEK